MENYLTALKDDKKVKRSNPDSRWIIPVWNLAIINKYSSYASPLTTGLINFRNAEADQHYGYGYDDTRTPSVKRDPHVAGLATTHIQKVCLATCVLIIQQFVQCDTFVTFLTMLHCFYFLEPNMRKTVVYKSRSLDTSQNLLLWKLWFVPR